MQTKKQSLTESIINILIGYLVSLISIFVLFPILGINTHYTTNIKLSLYFTIISLMRSYLIRRFFNKKQETE